MEKQSDTIFEEREEHMVSSAGGLPTLRKAHFLKPTFTSNGGKFYEPPADCLSPKQRIHNLEDLSEKLSFKGWKRPTEKWKRWVQIMHAKHQALWKQVGIYDAVMSSRYEMKQHRELVLAFAQRWCPDTNTFIFPWGEATITLEDVMVSGGYSVLGASVLSPLKTKEQVEVERKLIEGRKEAATSGSFCATHKSWMDHFMGTGLDLEHEAFLSLWLCKFVLMKSSTVQVIGKHVFPIAIHLARGTRIALAPAVLSNIYRDLSLLKDWFFGSNVAQTNELLNLFAPFQLVQLWVWERFPTLQPVANSISHGEPRVAKWHRLKVNVGNVTLAMAIDSAGDGFLWRPYTLGVKDCSLKFYGDKEQYIPLDSHLDEYVKSFAVCLRVSELVGLESIEQYLPHRVSMQFGMDQDLPGCIIRCNGNPEIAWRNYSRPIADAVIYIPPRLFESDVTKQYSDWWEQSVLARVDVNKPFEKNHRSPRKLPHVSLRKKECHIFFPADYPSNCVEVSRGDSAKGNEDRGVEARDLVQKEVMEDGIAVREFLAYAKHNSEKMVIDVEGECRLGSKSPLPSTKEVETLTNMKPGQVSTEASLKDQQVILENISERDEFGCILPAHVLPLSVGGSQNVSNSIADKEDSEMIKSQVKQDAGVPRNESSIEESSSPEAVDIKSQPSVKVGAGERWKTMELELEARICKLEKLSAELKKKRFCNK